MNARYRGPIAAYAALVSNQEVVPVTHDLGEQAS